jgi:hypothetical protein
MKRIGLSNRRRDAERKKTTTLSDHHPDNYSAIVLDMSLYHLELFIAYIYIPIYIYTYIYVCIYIYTYVWLKLEFTTQKIQDHCGKAPLLLAIRVIFPKTFIGSAPAKTGSQRLSSWANAAGNLACKRSLSFCNWGASMIFLDGSRLAFNLDPYRKKCTDNLQEERLKEGC